MRRITQGEVRCGDSQPNKSQNVLNACILSAAAAVLSTAGIILLRSMNGEIRSPKMDLGNLTPVEESLQRSRNIGGAGEHIHRRMNGFVLVAVFTHPQMAPAACVYFKSAVARIDS